jgi:predicted DNA binding CopG/RHH family protein
VKPYRWNHDKNAELKRDRGIGFEDIVLAIEAGGLLDVVRHPNPQRYPRQQMLVVALDGYVHLVPPVEEDDYVFLKTVIPSRKMTVFTSARSRPMKKLDAEERAMLRDFESGALESITPSRADLARFKAAATATFIKDRRVNIRLSTPDLMDIQARAMEEGLPYQTFIASVLHKFAAGRLREQPARVAARPPARRRRTAA